MGHCEMILAVAGKSEDEVNEVTRQLATGGANLPPEQRAALDFACKLARNPVVSDADVAELERQCGPEKALEVIWWASRCHYMTRVADAFQFPLERDNPFRAMPGAKLKK
jgi:alkylhydroperoxidase family enzyme